VQSYFLQHHSLYRIVTSLEHRLYLSTMAQYSHSESLFPSTFWHSYLPRHQEYPQAVTSSDPEPSSETVSSSIQPRAQISAFLTLLPLEIRLQIYSEILSSHTIPLCLTNNGENLTLPPSRLALKLLSLPLTCHQMFVLPFSPFLPSTSLTNQFL
jgi:hypothetical protein